MRTIPVQLLLPPACIWVRAVAWRYANAGVSADRSGIPELRQFFSPETLRWSRIVLVDAVPTPPLARLVYGPPDGGGVPGPAGLTLRNIVFVRRDFGVHPSMIFHELVHVVQWSSLGVCRFLAVYLAEMARHGYLDNALETMAVDLQCRFDAHQSVAFDVEAEVRERCCQMGMKARQR